MRWGKMHSRGQIFFLRVGVGAWGNLMFPLISIHFYHVPTKFPKFSICSQHVPNSTICNPISFAQTSHLVTYKEKPTISILGIPKIWSQFFCDGQIKEALLSKSEKKFEHLGSPQLSNMNHTILYTLCDEWHVERNFVRHLLSLSIYFSHKLVMSTYDWINLSAFGVQHVEHNYVHWEGIQAWANAINM